MGKGGRGKGKGGKGKGEGGTNQLARRASPVVQQRNQAEVARTAAMKRSTGTGGISNRSADCAIRRAFSYGRKTQICEEQQP